MYRRIVKRCIDVLFALVGLPFLLIIFISVSPFIYFSDRGPIFYNALRIGKNGKLFKMYKFRSMKINAPDIRLADGSTYNSINDPRVTGIGRFLRKTSLDEAPQILNVLLGNMSIIGPRPDPPDWLECYSENIKVFLTVRPGITGYNQAYFRNSADGEEKMNNDAYYALNYSLLLDVKIFFKTIAIVLKRENIFKDIDSIQLSNIIITDLDQDKKEENISAEVN